MTSEGFEKVNEHFHLIFPSVSKQGIDLMINSIAIFYLKNLPEAPLSTLRANLNGYLYRFSFSIFFILKFYH